MAYLAPLPKKSPKDHRIIIIYKTDDVVKYFWITSKIDKAKMILRNDPNAYVEISQNEWNVLTKAKSCVQCDIMHLEEISVYELQKMYTENTITYLGKIPESIQDKIKKAINNSISYNFIEQEILSK